MTKMYFIGADGGNLGYMGGDAYMAMIKSCDAKYGKALNNIPGGSDGFYAQLFNDYRGVKRLTVDEYLDIVKVNPLGLSTESWRLLEQVFGKSADGYSGDPHATGVEYERYEKRFSASSILSVSRRGCRRSFGMMILPLVPRYAPKK